MGLRQTGRLIMVLRVLCGLVAACGVGPSDWSASPTTSPSASVEGPGPHGISGAGQRLRVTDFLSGRLMVTADGMVIAGWFQCGGVLSGTESARGVLLSFTTPAAVGGPASSCGRRSLTVALSSPLGHRAIIDAESGTSLPYGVGVLGPAPY
jgi:hypothetical protein